MGEAPSPWLAERVRAGRLAEAGPPLAAEPWRSDDGGFYFKSHTVERDGGAMTVAGFFKSHMVEIERRASGETLATVTRWWR
ncbi:hypothetical protein HanHA89_Chr08g0289871 [Helianthus annuus]|nr:hypothetical protein HanHA89_Chr08g0289871 [Helianthus annuus]